MLNEKQIKILKKAYWKTRNFVQARILRLVGNPGLLTPRKDPRDFESDFGVGFVSYETKKENLSLFRFQFIQRDNICTAAAFILAVSEQTGIRWSVKAMVRMMVKLGMVHGNGFSYQRAPFEVALKYGLVPYDLMPDENDKGWGEYSRWDAETERLYAEVAPKYKFTAYKKLVNDKAILEAADGGFVSVTASDWKSDMNRPHAPEFLLTLTGYFIGGHQYRRTGYKTRGRILEVPQTFGPNYGDHGKAYAKTSFGKGYYENYIIEHNGNPILPVETILSLFTKQNEGLLVRSEENPACFVIEYGKKRHVKGDDQMKTFFSLYEKLGLTYVKQQLLEAVPQGEDYPLI